MIDHSFFNINSIKDINKLIKNKFIETYLNFVFLVLNAMLIILSNKSIILNIIIQL